LAVDTSLATSSIHSRNAALRIVAVEQPRSEIDEFGNFLPVQSDDQHFPGWEVPVQSTDPYASVFGDLGH